MDDHSENHHLVPHAQYLCTSNHSAQLEVGRCLYRYLSPACEMA